MGCSRKQNIGVCEDFWVVKKKLQASTLHSRMARKIYLFVLYIVCAATILRCTEAGRGQVSMAITNNHPRRDNSPSTPKATRLTEGHKLTRVKLLESIPTSKKWDNSVLCAPCSSPVPSTPPASQTPFPPASQTPFTGNPPAPPAFSPPPPILTSPASPAIIAEPPCHDRGMSPPAPIATTPPLPSPVVTNPPTPIPYISPPAPATPVIPSPPIEYMPSPPPYNTPTTPSTPIIPSPPVTYMPSPPVTPVVPSPPVTYMPSPSPPVTYMPSPPATPVTPSPPEIYMPSPPITPATPSPPVTYMPSPPATPLVPSPPVTYLPPYSAPSAPANPPSTSPPGVFPAPPNVFPVPPNAAPPPPYTPSTPPGQGVWCVARPTVQSSEIEQAMNFACGSGADCQAVQPNGACFLPDTVIAHASYAFNSYWQMSKASGATCDFGGTAMVVTVDPSYDNCHFVYNL